MTLVGWLREMHSASLWEWKPSAHENMLICCITTAVNRLHVSYFHTHLLVLLTLRSSSLRVFGNRVLRRVFGPKRDEVTGEWRKLHNEELNELYSLLNIVRVVKSRRMRWAGHVARMGGG